MIVRFSPRPEDLQRLQVGPIGPHLLVSQLIGLIAQAARHHRAHFVETLK